jgi:hypothetical protein
VAKSEKKSTTPWPGLRRKIEELAPQLEAIENLRAAFQAAADRDYALPTLDDLNNELIQAGVSREIMRDKRFARELARVLEQNKHAKPRKHDGRLVTAAKADLKKLYPRRVPDDISTTQVQNELNVPFEKQGRKGYSYDTVRRALGRRK